MRLFSNRSEKTSKCGKNISRLTARVPLFCSYHILTSSVIYYWTDALQHGIYLLNRSTRLGSGGCERGPRAGILKMVAGRHHWLRSRATYAIFLPRVFRWRYTGRFATTIFRATKHRFLMYVRRNDFQRNLDAKSVGNRRVTRDDFLRNGGSE